MTECLAKDSFVLIRLVLDLPAFSRLWKRGERPGGSPQAAPLSGAGGLPRTLLRASPAWSEHPSLASETWMQRHVLQPLPCPSGSSRTHPFTSETQNLGSSSHLASPLL